MEISAIISIAEAVFSEVPEIVTLVKNIIPSLKSGTAPTDDEWNTITTSLQAAHEKLQADCDKALASDTSTADASTSN